MTTEVQYSRYTQAALEQNDELAQIPRAHSRAVDIPHPGSDEVRALWGLTKEKRLARSSGLPSVPETLEETKRALKEKYYNHDLEVVAGVDARALWAATTMAGIDMPDSVEASLVRVDKHEERQARYRAATDGRWRAAPTLTHEEHQQIVVYIPSRVIAYIHGLAAMRGEHFDATLRFAIESGCILADERAKRYEACVLKEMRQYVESLPRTAQPAAVEALEPDRYIDPHSPSMQRAYNLAYPTNGAPPTIARLVDAQPPIPKDTSWVRTRWY